MCQTRMIKQASPRQGTSAIISIVCLLTCSCCQVMKVLLRNHGLNLMGVKTNLYTSIGDANRHVSVRILTYLSVKQALIANTRAESRLR